MALDFSKPQAQMSPGTGMVPAQAAVPAEVIEEPVKYDIVADRQAMNELVGSKEVDELASRLDVYDLESIVSFGAETAEEISKASDVVLNSMNSSKLNESSEMMNALAKIMGEFDIDEIKDDPGFFKKLFGSMKKQLDKILAKYHTMGEQVDKIYVELKKYESEIKQANRNLSQMFDANVGYYHQLVKYILAGEQGCREIEAYIAQRQADL